MIEDSHELEQMQDEVDDRERALVDEARQALVREPLRSEPSKASEAGARD